MAAPAAERLRCRLLSEWRCARWGFAWSVGDRPRSGPSLVVANHGSWLDVLVLAAAGPIVPLVDRPCPASRRSGRWRQDGRDVPSTRGIPGPFRHCRAGHRHPAPVVIGSWFSQAGAQASGCSPRAAFTGRHFRRRSTLRSSISPVAISYRDRGRSTTIDAGWSGLALANPAGRSAHGPGDLVARHPGGRRLRAPLRPSGRCCPADRMGDRSGFGQRVARRYRGRRRRRSPCPSLDPPESAQASSARPTAVRAPTAEDDFR